MASTKKKNRSKKYYLILLIVVTIIGTGALALYVRNDNKDVSSSKTPGDKARPVGSVDYGPPTEQERQAGDEQKEKNLEKEQLIKNNPDNTRANVIVTDASQYSDIVEVRAYIANVYEDGGKCTAIFTKSGATTVTKSSVAFKDATTTLCGAINIPRSEFSSSGSWGVVVQYKSSTNSGESDKRVVKLN